MPTKGRVRPTRAETRERVLAAAAVAFGRSGYERTSLDDVAAEAGLTKGAIYSSYKSKQELFAALMTTQIRARLDGVMAAVAGTTTVVELAGRTGQAMADATFGDPDWHVAFLEFWTRVMRQDDLRQAFAVERATTHAAIAEMLRAYATAADVALPLAPDRLAVVLLALSNGLAIEQLPDPDRADRSLFAETLQALVR